MSTGRLLEDFCSKRLWRGEKWMRLGAILNDLDLKLARGTKVNNPTIGTLPAFCRNTYEYLVYRFEHVSGAVQVPRVLGPAELPARNRASLRKGRCDWGRRPVHGRVLSHRVDSSLVAGSRPAKYDCLFSVQQNIWRNKGYFRGQWRLNDDGAIRAGLR